MTDHNAGIRLDAALPERGLARSRTHAATLVAEGLVTVNGKAILKASTKVFPSQRIEVAGADHYVSRAAHKLIAALDAFAVTVEGATVLDAGASTGGFSQVLLERAAGKVLAVDVGHGQLAPELLNDERLTLVEGYNVRYMTAASLAAASRWEARPSVVVADLSFISLITVLPAFVETAADGADFVLLIKPQFEVGRTGIREGLVKNPGLRAEAVNAVLWAAHDLGLRTAGLVPSPIAGGSGNQEYLVWFSTTQGSDPSEWIDRVTAMTGA